MPREHARELAVHGLAGVPTSGTVIRPDRPARATRPDIPLS